MRCTKIFITIVCGCLLLTSCSAVPNDKIDFESKVIEESVRNALGITQEDITVDMLNQLKSAQIANGKVFFDSSSNYNNHEEEHEIKPARNTQTDLPISFRIEELGKSPTIYWEDSPMEIIDVDLIGLEDLPSIESLTVFAPSSDTLQKIVQLDTIHHLILYLQADQTIEIPDMSGMTQLESLDISGGHLKNVEHISSAKQLTQLNLMDSVEVENWNFLTKLDKLEHLTLPSAFSDLSLVNGKNLKYLNLSQTRVTDISSVAQMNQLETLNLTGLDIKDFSPSKTVKNIIK